MYTDIELINEYVQNKMVKSIGAVVTMGGIDYTFSNQIVPKLPIRMTLPDNIDIMSADSIKMKYPDENRPKVILSFPADETVNFLYTQIYEDVSQQELSDIIQGLQAVLKRMHGGAVFYEKGNIVCELSEIFWFDYCTAALDDDIYNLMYVLCLHDTLLLGSFCCLKKYRKLWKPLVLQMIATITM